MDGFTIFRLSGRVSQSLSGHQTGGGWLAVVVHPSHSSSISHSTGRISFALFQRWRRLFASERKVHSHVFANQRTNERAGGGRQAARHPPGHGPFRRQTLESSLRSALAVERAKSATFRRFFQLTRDQYMPNLVVQYRAHPTAALVSSRVIGKHPKLRDEELRHLYYAVFISSEKTSYGIIGEYKIRLNILNTLINFV